MQIKTLARAARLPFLLLTPICILLAYAIATMTTPSPNLADTLMILLGALAAHVAVNLINEYQDFASGLDLNTIKTPFSGGSGALPDNPAGARSVFLGGLVCLAVVCWVGFHFLFAEGILVLAPMGICGLLLIIGYTRYINRQPWLCLLAPGFGFGTLMVLSSVLLLSGTISSSAFLLSSVVFFQVNNLLLLNQFPDIAADRAAGRRHFAIAYGPLSAARVYAVFMIIPFIIILTLVISAKLPLVALIALLPLLPAIAVTKGLFTHLADIASAVQYMGMNVMVTLSTPLLLSLALLFG